ncbi:MAG: hypothetical protein KatS3mg102_2333 [Planctomycetota bacterium]|nr:MAG: hypothetical protein KatS3mg102_2333 [Planctomycetota bacterium]
MGSSGRQGGGLGAPRRWGAALAAVLWLVQPAVASGHGPVFGLATPTLGKGGWSLDVGAMYRSAADARLHAAMLKPMLSYGITEDVQISLSLPVPLYRDAGLGQARMLMMMPAGTDVELLLGWRFHRRAPAVGTRWESTAYLGVQYPVESRRQGVRTGPGLLGALATGYVSRSVYVWIGGLYQSRFDASGDRGDDEGDVAMLSLVLGYRPALFRREPPSPDWRLFVEAVAEWTDVDRIDGRVRRDSGGWQVFVGPSVLGLYGAWGIGGGVLLPVHAHLHGAQRRDDLRAALNLTYWF